MNVVYEVSQGTGNRASSFVGLYSTFDKAKNTVEGILEQIAYYQRPISEDVDKSELSGLYTWHWEFRNPTYDLRIYEVKLH
jgi:hypothetical protein